MTSLGFAPAQVPGLAATGEYDYVIVGSGAAGSILANRLTEDGTATVCLLEAGPRDRHPLLHVPAGFTKLLRDPRYTWQLSSEPEETTAGRRIPTPQGRTLGGSTAVHGLLYARGQPEDFDEWAALGNSGWGYRDVLPYFMRNESWRGAEGGVHRGRTGPQPVTRLDWKLPLTERFIEGATSLGMPRNPDYNGPDQSGVGYYQCTILGRWRVGTARSYLRPALGRPNLDVRTEAQATRVVFENGRAAGVEYVNAARPGPAVLVRARREVLLCCGALNTPKLLLLSGVGAANRLQELGIAVTSDLPGVGRGLRDHYSARVVTTIQGARTINEMSRGPALWMQVARWLAGRSSILSLSPGIVHFFWNSKTGTGRPDLQGVFTPAALSDRPGLFESRPAVTCAVWQHRPYSSGSVGLRSPDPLAPPVIHPNYLSDERDRVVLVDGLRLARRLLRSPAFAPHLGEELRPGAQAQTDEELVAYAREFGASSYHYNGTARMGPASDRESVVDESLRVRGVAGLRVVDASVMPTTPSGNTCAPTMMLAEKAADLIRGRAPLPAMSLATA